MENKANILDTLYDSVKVCITHEILKEIKHFRLTSCDITRTHILPAKLNRIYQDSISLGFDEADASLLSNVVKTENNYGITEDQPLILLGTRYGANIMQLIDLFQFLTSQEKITKNTLYKMTQELRNLRNISKKKEKYMKKWMQNN